MKWNCLRKDRQIFEEFSEEWEREPRMALETVMEMDTAALGVRK